MPSGTELSRSSSYQCGKVWNSPFIAAGSKGNPSPVLVVALATQHPSPQRLQLQEHEYSLTSEVDSGWAAKPLALTRQEGPTILVLKDFGGKPSVRFFCHARATARSRPLVPPSEVSGLDDFRVISQVRSPY
jgi:hypothetical protein